jgi:hypothetical protein
MTLEASNQTEPVKGQYLKETAEYFLQKKIVEYCKETYPILTTLLFFCNNSAPDAYLGGQAKALGLTRGVFDLISLTPNASFNGFCAEIKCGVNTLSAEQETFKAAAEANNYKCFVFYSFHEAKEKIDTYMAHVTKRRGAPSKRKATIGDN